MLSTPPLCVASGRPQAAFACTNCGCGLRPHLRNRQCQTYSGPGALFRHQALALDALVSPFPPMSATLQHVELSLHERLFCPVKRAHGLLVSCACLLYACAQCSINPVVAPSVPLVQVSVLDGAVCERCYARGKGFVVLPFRRVAHPAPLSPHFCVMFTCPPFSLRPPLFQGVHAPRGWPAGRVRLPRVPHD